MKVASILVLVGTSSAIASSAPLDFDFDSVEFANANRRAIIERVTADPKATWVAASPIGRFANTPYSVLRMYGAGVLGGNPVENEAGLPTKTLEDLQKRFSGPIPAAFDATQHWSWVCPMMLEIRDQSACGSCYAVSAASTATDRFCIAHNGTKQDRLASVDLMSCCKTCAGANGGCYGGTPSKCWDYMSSQGIATGGAYGDKSRCLEYPFPMCSHHVNGTYPTCPEQSYNAPTCFWECDEDTTDKHTYDQEQEAHVFGTSYQVAANVAAIQTDIMAHGPVQASMFLTSEFETYKSGVFTTKSTNYIGAHAVKIVGWGTDNVTAVDYWRVQNSWNDEWGESGYFRIQRGIDCLSIEASVVAGTWGPKW